MCMVESCLNKLEKNSMTLVRWRICFLALFVAFSTGCKIGIVVPEEGLVETISEVYRCNPGASCQIDLPANLGQHSVAWDHVYPEDEGSTHGIGQLSLSADGNELTGGENWEYSERGYSCEGYDEITLTRL